MFLSKDPFFDIKNHQAGRKSSAHGCLSKRNMWTDEVGYLDFLVNL